MNVARHVFFAALLSVPAACGDGDDDGSGSPDCGDGRCSTTRCETTVRCPKDCGACVGTECDVGGPNGSCGEPCESSCDCLNQAEFCSADYGFTDGVCMPVACLNACATVEACMFTPGATGTCDSVSCG